MRNLRIISFVILLALAANISLEMQGEAEGVGAATFLRFGQDAKALGMGGAFVAIADNYSASYWNPAGVAISKESRFGGMYTQPYQVEDLNLALLAGKTTLMNIGVGGAYTRLYTSYLSTREETAGELLAYSESLYIATGACKLKDLAIVGGSFKFYDFAAPGGGVGSQNATAHGLGFDLGALYYHQNPSIALGGAVFDLGDSNIRWKGTPAEPVNQVPVIYRVGAAHSIGLVNATVAFGYDFTSNRNIEQGAARNVIRFGVEYKPASQLAIRVGAIKPLDESISYTMGAGVSINSLNVDFAWLQKPGNLGQAVEGSVGNTIVLSAEYKL